MSDLNRRIAEARGDRVVLPTRTVMSKVHYNHPDKGVRPGPYDYVSDKAATLDALESLIDAGWLAFRHRVFTDKRCLQSPVGYPHLCESDTLSEAIWRAWLAWKEKTDE